MKGPTHQWMIEDCLDIINAVDQALFLFNQRNEVLFANRAFTDMLLLDKGKSVADHVHKKLKTIAESELNDFWNGDQSHIEIDSPFAFAKDFYIHIVKHREDAALAVMKPKVDEIDQLQKDYSYLLAESNNRHNFKKIISNNERYLKILTQLVKVADTSTTVLIHGETGTGKELLARATYNMSGRKNRPLIKFDCAAVSDQMVERELFGYEPNAFPGAYERKLGLFEVADGGTIFLDEISELPLSVQPKLLQVIQEGKLCRLGSTEEIVTDVRIIVSTNRDLKQMIEEGSFRKDLFYRLNVFPIHSIPLRERRSDIPLLVNHFRKKYAAKNAKRISRVSDKELRQLMFYDFPGNVRELENMIERAVILSDSRKLNIAAVVPDLVFDQQKEDGKNKFLTFEQMQREHILSALEKSQWRVSGKYSAASLLDLNPKTLASKMRKLAIHRSDHIAT